MKALTTVAIAAIFAVAVMVFPGCSSAPTSDQGKTDAIASLIQVGTTSATAIGLTAVPDKTEADTIAKDAIQALNNEVLPVLNGDDAAILNGLNDILALKAFNTPALGKFKAIVQAALPLLMDYIPQDVISGQVNKVPPDVKEYLQAFFTGVRNGCTAYVGSETPSVKVSPHEVNYRVLRNTLAAKKE